MTTVWAGLSVGAVYALIAIGYNITMTFGGVFNLAHAIFVILGGFFAWFLVVELGWAWWVPLILGTGLGALVGMATEYLTVRPVLRGKDHHALLVTAVGVLVLIEGLLLATWAKTPKSLPFVGGQEPLELLGGRLAPVDLTLIIIAIALGLGVHVISRRSLWGLAARGATSDPDAAKTVGINVGAIRMASFALAGMTAGLVGPIVVSKTGASVGIAVTLIIFGFVALAVGGFGSFIGSIVGGFVIGLIQSYSGRYLGVAYPPVLLFFLLLGILLLRPTGLFGRRGVRAI